MKTFNKIELLGNIGTEVKLEEKNDLSFVNFTVAENQTFKKKDGEKETRTQWHQVAAYNGTAKLIAQICKKGDSVLLHGRLDISEFEDNEGKKRASYRIIVDEFTNLTPKDKE